MFYFSYGSTVFVLTKTNIVETDIKVTSVIDISIMDKNNIEYVLSVGTTILETF